MDHGPSLILRPTRLVANTAMSRSRSREDSRMSTLLDPRQWIEVTQTLPMFMTGMLLTSKISQGGGCRDGRPMGPLTHPDAVDPST